LLRESAASSVVLLRNSAGTLPLNLAPGSKVCVIGPNAKIANIAGGGSASLTPTYSVTPFDAISTACKELGVTVEYSLGVDGSKWTPLLDQMIESPRGERGQVHADFFTEK
jgi:beta-glucosidase